MKHKYIKTYCIEYNDNIFQVLVRDDNKYGFLKIVSDHEKEKYVYPTAQEFLHLSSMLNTKNRIKF